MQAKWKTYTKEQIYQFYTESKTWTDFFTKMGYKAANDYGYTKKQLQKVYPDITFGHSKKKPKQRFGKLTLIEDIGRTEKGLVIWKCQCDCGSFVERTAKGLNENSSCEQCRRDASAENQRKDISGQTFNFLTPIKCIGNVDGGGTRWVCKCDLCNSLTKPILINNITTGAIKSCGYLKSSGEAILRKVLNEMQIDYITEYSFEDLIGDKTNLRFDFALFKEQKLLCLIECQGEQHNSSIDYFGGKESFEKRQRYDNMKKEYCLKHNISLLYIPYKDYKNISKEYIMNLLSK